MKSLKVFVCLFILYTSWLENGSPNPTPMDVRQAKKVMKFVKTELVLEKNPGLKRKPRKRFWDSQKIMKKLHRIGRADGMSKADMGNGFNAFVSNLEDMVRAKFTQD